MRKITSFLLFLGLFFLASCATKEDEQEESLKEAIDTARIYLTKNKCDEAIKTLGAVEGASKNAEYLKALASSFACRSGYRTPTFYGTDLAKIGSTQSTFFSGLATFTTSEMISPIDASFLDLQEAINILLYAGEVVVPSAAERIKVFSSIEASDINIYALYMILVQLGKYLYYYGNANPVTGEKGAGATANGNTNRLTNGCLYDYSPVDSDLATTIDAARSAEILGSCTATATGHVKLAALPNVTTVSRMCQGVVLFNQMLDLLSNITIPTSSGSLDSIGTLFTDVCSSISQTSEVCSVLSQSECEVNFSVSAAEADKLQAYFFIFFESNF